MVAAHEEEGERGWLQHTRRRRGREGGQPVGHSYGGCWYGTETADLVWERSVLHVVVILGVGDEGFEGATKVVLVE